jgi:rRNA processing protein Krr1/Pno1
MTPREKAREIVNNIQEGLWRDRAVKICQEDAIYSAVIVVEDLIEEVREFCDDNFHSDRLVYWQEVKQEIENF